MKIKVYLFTFVLLLGCQDYNSNTSDGIKYRDIEVDDGGDPNFAAAKSVIDRRCVSCHSGAHNNWANRDNEQWLADPMMPVLRGDPDNSPLIIRTINTGGSSANMPLGGSAIPASEYTALKTWITSIP